MFLHSVVRAQRSPVAQRAAKRIKTVARAKPARRVDGAAESAP
jgi:hypothetical protein